MNKAERNFRLLQEIEASRKFLLMACQQNPALLERADARIKQILGIPASQEHPVCQTLPDDVSKQRGISLIELIIFMIIISIAVTGVLLVMNRVTGQSADAVIRKQALAIAESVLAEVEAMPFTFCDPDDPSAATAANAAGCTAGMAQTLGAGPVPVTESRYNPADPLDNVADYANCRLNTAGGSSGCDAAVINAIRDITGTNNAALGGYNATVAIVNAGLALGLPTDADALRITVTVNGAANTQVTLDGYRSRYSPNLR
jgi:MSHA pilin protein MshD